MEFNKKILAGICVLILGLAGCSKPQSGQGNGSNGQSSTENSSQVSDSGKEDGKTDGKKEDAKDDSNAGKTDGSTTDSGTTNNGAQDGTSSEGNGTGSTDTAPGTQNQTGNSTSVKIGDKDVQVTWENNETVEALKQLSPLTVQLSPYGGVELSGNIGTTIPSVFTEMTTSPGDIVIYEGNTLIVAVEPNTCQYTKVGKINLSEAELKELLAKGNVTITLNIQ